MNEMMMVIKHCHGLNYSHTSENRICHNALQSNESHKISSGQQHIHITLIITKGLKLPGVTGFLTMFQKKYREKYGQKPTFI